VEDQKTSATSGLSAREALIAGIPPNMAIREHHRAEKTKMIGIHFRKRIVVLSVTAVAILVAVDLVESGRNRNVRLLNFSHIQQVAAAVLDGGSPNATQQSGENAHRFNTNTDAANLALDLSPTQLNSIKIQPVGTYEFPVEKEAVGNISFADEQSVQVFPAYQGTIIKALAQLGDLVQKDQPLYTITSPDLIQAVSTLIGAAATFELTNK
jgi:biotin carboxyl carrier protein